MWEWAWENACPREWGCRKKAQDLAQSYKINGSTNGFENKDFASFKVRFYSCGKRIGRFDSGVEKSAAQNVASQGPVHDCISINLKICRKIAKYPKISEYIWIYLKTSGNIRTNLKRCKIMHKSLDSDWDIQSDIDNALNSNVIKFKIIQQNSKKSENISLAFMNLNSDL